KVKPRTRLASRASAATHQNQPRQPISAPTAAAIGTPTTRVSDWPVITQPMARPRWLSGTWADTSAKIVPMKAPQQAPPAAAHTAIQKKEPASACAAMASARVLSPLTSTGVPPDQAEPARAQAQEC